MMHRFLEFIPYSVKEWQLLAQIYEAAGQEEKARIAWENVERVRDNIHTMLYRDALVAALHGADERAARLLRRLVREAPDKEGPRRDLERLERGEDLL
jgi:hypothetical protein